jgi:hypothetical protein
VTVFAFTDTAADATLGRMSTAAVAMEAAKNIEGRMDLSSLWGGHHKPSRDSSFSHLDE